MIAQHFERQSTLRNWVPAYRGQTEKSRPKRSCAVLSTQPNPALAGDTHGHSRRNVVGRDYTARNRGHADAAVGDLEIDVPATTAAPVIGVLVVCLAFSFWSAFMFLKHDPVLGQVIPFGNDPYDAVGSFAALGAVFIGVLSVFRGFRPASIGPAAPQLIYLVRTEAAVVLCVLIACAADGIALARQVPEWIHAGARLRLPATLITLVVTSICLLAIVRPPAETHRSAAGPRTLRTARSTIDGGRLR